MWDIFRSRIPHLDHYAGPTFFLLSIILSVTNISHCNHFWGFKMGHSASKIDVVTNEDQEFVGARNHTKKKSLSADDIYGYFKLLKDMTGAVTARIEGGVDENMDDVDKAGIDHHGTVWDCVIVGGGVSGLQCARTLVDIYNLSPAKILILEAESRMGGQLLQDSVVVAGTKVDLGCHRYDSRDELVSAYANALDMPAHADNAILACGGLPEAQEHVVSIEPDSGTYSVVSSQPSFVRSFRRSFAVLLDYLQVGLEVRTRCAVREIGCSHKWVNVLVNKHNDTNTINIKARCVVVSSSPSLFTGVDRGRQLATTISFVPAFPPDRMLEIQKFSSMSSSLGQQRVIVCSLSFAHRPWPASMKALTLTCSGPAESEQTLLLPAEYTFSVADTNTHSEGKFIANTAHIATVVCHGVVAERLHTLSQQSQAVVGAQLVQQLEQALGAIRESCDSGSQKSSSSLLPTASAAFLNCCMHEWSAATHPRIPTCTGREELQSRHDVAVDFSLLSKSVDTADGSGKVIFCGDYLHAHITTATNNANNTTADTYTNTTTNTSTYSTGMFTLEAAILSGVRAAGDVAAHLGVTQEV
jgi:hypothetical protein